MNSDEDLYATDEDLFGWTWPHYETDTNIRSARDYYLDGTFEAVEGLQAGSMQDHLSYRLIVPLAESMHEAFLKVMQPF